MPAGRCFIILQTRFANKPSGTTKYVESWAVILVCCCPVCAWFDININACVCVYSQKESHMARLLSGTEELMGYISSEDTWTKK